MNEEIRIDRRLVRTILLILAGLSFVVFAVAFFADGAQFSTVPRVALIVAVLALAGFVLADPEATTETVTGRTGQYALTTTLMSVIFVAFVIVLFWVIRTQEWEPIDLSEGQQYELSEATLDLLGSIEEPIKVIAFFDNQSREEAEIWLQNYSRASNEMLTWEWADADRNPALAQQYGITRNGLMVFVQGDRNSQAQFPNEEQMTNALVRVLSGEPRIAYVLTGHGEKDIFGFAPDQLGNASEDLQNANFVLQTLNLLEVEAVPEDANVLFIPGPVAQFSASDVEKIKAYLDAGGSLVLLSDPGTSIGGVAAGVRAVSFNDDGSRFASAGADGTIRIWDTANRREETALRGHTSEVTDVAFSPDGDLIASMSRDGSVRIWDAASGEPLQVLAGHQANLGRIAFSPDGRYLASTGVDQAVRVWDTSSWELMPYAPLALPFPGYSLNFSPDGESLAVIAGVTAGATAGEGRLYLYEVSSGDEIASPRLHSDIPFDVAFSPDGAEIHSVAIDGTEGIYTVEDRDATTVSPYSGAISAFAYMPDGQRIYAVLNQDGLVSIHIRPADSNDAGDDVVLEGHTDIIWDFALSGDTLLSASRDGDVRLWSVGGARQVGLVQAAHSSADPLLLYVTESWGIDIGEDIVIDTATAGEVADEFTPVIYYAGSESPIVTPLFASGVRPFLIGASSVTPGVSAPADITVQSLLLTTPGTSWAETTDPLTVQPIYEEGLDLPGPVSVGASAENFTTGARVVVIGDADFATNNALQLTTYGNADLLVNAFDWASPSENSVQLPPPDFSQNLMDKPFSLVELRVVQILLACIVPPSLMVIGVAIWFQRRRRR